PCSPEDERRARDGVEPFPRRDPPEPAGPGHAFAGSRCRPGGSGGRRHRGSPGGARGAGDGRAPAGGDQGPPAAELTGSGETEMAAGRRDGPSAIERSIDSYLDHLAVERGLAKRSVEAYGRDLSAFARGLVARRVRNPTAVRADDVRAHLVALEGRR